MAYSPPSMAARVFMFRVVFNMLGVMYYGMAGLDAFTAMHEVLFAGAAQSFSPSRNPHRPTQAELKHLSYLLAVLQGYLDNLTTLLANSAATSNTDLHERPDRVLSILALSRELKDKVRYWRKVASLRLVDLRCLFNQTREPGPGELWFDLKIHSVEMLVTGSSRDDLTGVIEKAKKALMGTTVNTDEGVIGTGSLFAVCTRSAAEQIRDHAQFAQEETVPFRVFVDTLADGIFNYRRFEYYMDGVHLVACFLFLFHSRLRRLVTVMDFPPPTGAASSSSSSSTTPSADTASTGAVSTEGSTTDGPAISAANTADAKVHKRTDSDDSTSSYYTAMEWPARPKK